MKIAMMTSGGDAPGMNAALRAVVRRASVLNAEVHAIYEGYVGMIAGDSCIKRLKWDDVSGLLPKVTRLFFLWNQFDNFCFYREEPSLELAAVPNFKKEKEERWQPKTC